MSQFVSLTDGTYVNLNRVVTVRRQSVRSDSGRKYEYAVEYRHADGQAGHGIVSDPDWCPQDMGPVLPAQPGYFLVEMSREPPCEVYLEPILGWRAGEYAEPVSLGFNSPEAAILCPDGQVFEPGLALYAHVDAYRAAKIKELRERAAHEADSQNVAPARQEGGVTDDGRTV
ncbi:MAG: hypothetical protein M0038_06590 [Pseudomonadota bacterium]|nr:hypothetical protein [Pseudomonadota bacterium]